MKKAKLFLPFGSSTILTLLFLVLFNLLSCEPIRAANLIRNGEFQLNSSFWHAKYWFKSKIDYLVTEDINIQTEKSGNSYQLVVPVNQPTQTVRIMSDPFPILDNSAFSFSMNIRTTGSPRNVSVTILNDRILLNRNFNVSKDWQNITFSGDIPSSNLNMCRVEIKTSGEQGTIYLSSVRLEQPQPTQIGDNIVQLNFQSNKPLSMFELGNEVSFTVRSSIPANVSVPVNWSLTDIYGNQVTSGQLNLTNGINSKKFSLGNLGLGWYSLQYSINKSGFKDINDRVAFTVIPKMSDRASIAPEKSIFGVHTEITRDGLLAAKLMGFKWIRLHSPLITKWNAVEETQGRFTFNDPAMSFIKSEGFSVVGTLDRTAAWASTGKDDPKTKSSNYLGAYSYFPEDWNRWKNYVSAVVTHYKNDIRYWQIWNEPDIQFLVPPKGVSNATAYNQLVTMTAPLVRNANPNAQILGGVAYLKLRYPGPGRQGNFLEEMGKLGIQKQLDFFTFHHYVNINENLDQDLNELASARSLLKDNSLRYWITEFGFSCSKSNKYDFENQDPKCMGLIDIAKIAVKYNVMNLSKGIERIFFYDAFFDTNGFPDFKNDVNIMWDSKEPRPIVSAYAIMTWLLDGAKFNNSFNKGAIQVFTFMNGKRTINVVWSSSGTTQLYNSDRTSKFISIDGSRTTVGKSYQITDEPVYIVYEE